MGFCFVSVGISLVCLVWLAPPFWMDHNLKPLNGDVCVCASPKLEIHKLFDSKIKLNFAFNGTLSGR